MGSFAVLPPFKLAEELVKDENRYEDIDATMQVTDLINRHLATPLLDELQHLLWLVAAKGGDHIDPLHVQVGVKGRTVRVVEDAGLHLVWNHDIIWIKPLPSMLLNHSFWRREILGEPNITTSPKNWQSSDLNASCRQALGYLRSYSFLIRSASDFRLAQSLYLISPAFTFAQVNTMLSNFRGISDEFVTVRYRWGQLRLSRLNWAIRMRFISSPSLSTWRWYYQESHWNSKQYLQRFGAPFLFLFAATSLMLSSMQVVHAARGEETSVVFSDVSYVFSLACMASIAFLASIFLAGILIMLLLQLAFAVRTGRP